MKVMNIRKKLLTLAVASTVSGGAMMVAAPAHAMNVSQDGVGEVLLFPYYTVKNGMDTLLTVTNTANTTAVFKVRFREALNSREVRDFNVILSPYDHWGAVVTATTDGALLRTFDKTCTSPQLPVSATAAGATEVAFTNALYSGNFTDGATEELSRVKEGYFEVILMGQAPNVAATYGDVTVSTNVLTYNAKHVNGVPRDCAKVDAMFLPGAAGLGTITNPANVAAPTNILKGHTTFINVTNGTAIDAEPTAIEDFVSANIVAAPGDVVPDLRDGDALSASSRFVNGAVVVTPFGSSEDGVSDLLRATAVVNEFATGSGAATSWVMTYPTKHHYTDAYTAVTGPTFDNGIPTGGFSEWFYTPVTLLVPGAVKNGKSCDNIGLSIFNREEGTILNLGNTNFSPAPTSASVEICYEANVVDYNGSNVFGAGTNRLGVSTASVGTAGWASLSFTEAPAIAAGGLPVIGFGATVRDAGGAAVNYGSSTAHSYRR